jgi:hypothetical protein
LPMRLGNTLPPPLPHSRPSAMSPSRSAVLSKRLHVWDPVQGLAHDASSHGLSEPHVLDLHLREDHLVRFFQVDTTDPLGKPLDQRQVAPATICNMPVPRQKAGTGRVGVNSGSAPRPRKGSGHRGGPDARAEDFSFTILPSYARCRRDHGTLLENARGFTGDPVPPGIRNGAAHNKNSLARQRVAT